MAKTYQQLERELHWAQARICELEQKIEALVKKLPPPPKLHRVGAKE